MSKSFAGPPQNASTPGCAGTAGLDTSFAAANPQAAAPVIHSPRQLGRFLKVASASAVAPTPVNIACWILAAFALATELLLTLVLWDARIYAWEQDLVRTLQTAPGRYVIFDVANFLTNTLSPTFLLIFLAVFLTTVALRHYAAAFVLVVALPVHVLAQFPKALVPRPRPSSLYPGIEGVGGLHSFPSGHSEFVISFYGFITFLLLMHIKKPWQRIAVVSFWLSLVAATGFGRLATGRHWPIDVFASYIVGLGALAGLIWLYLSLRTARAQVLENKRNLR